MTTRAKRLSELSRTRRETEKDTLRQSIADTAAQLFVEHGYEQLSMRQIAERIGYSATTIYRYFENKDALLASIVDEGFRRFGNELAGAARDLDGFERLKALGRAYVRFGVENPDHYRLMFMQRSEFLFRPRSGTTSAPIDSFAILRTAIESAMAAGLISRIASPDILSNAIWAMMHGITSLAIADKERFSQAVLMDTSEVMYQMIRRGTAA